MKNKTHTSIINAYTISVKTCKKLNLLIYTIGNKFQIEINDELGTILHTTEDVFELKAFLIGLIKGKEL